MSRTKTEADRKKEQDAEQGRGELRDTSGIPVGEEIPNLEDLASPSVAGRDLNPRDDGADQTSERNTAGTGTDTTDAEAEPSKASPTRGSAGASSANVSRGMQTAQREVPPVVEQPTPLIDSIFGKRDEQQQADDFIDPALLEKQAEQNRLMDFRRQQDMGAGIVYQTETEQREAALRQASKNR